MAKAKFHITTVNILDRVRKQAIRKVANLKSQGERISFSSYVQSLIEADTKEDAK